MGSSSTCLTVILLTSTLIDALLSEHNILTYSRNGLKWPVLRISYRSDSFILRVEDPTNNLICRYVNEDDYNLLLASLQLQPHLGPSNGFEGIDLRRVLSYPWTFKRNLRVDIYYEDSGENFPEGTSVYPALCTSPENKRPFPVLYAVPPQAPPQLPPAPTVSIIDYTPIVVPASPLRI